MMSVIDELLRQERATPKRDSRVHLTLDRVHRVGALSTETVTSSPPAAVGSTLPSGMGALSEHKAAARRTRRICPSAFTMLAAGGTSHA